MCVSQSRHKQDAWFYGYSQEMEAAWKCGHELYKQYTRDIKGDPLDELAPAIATWADGTRHAIPELSGVACRARTAASCVKKHFEGETEAGTPIVVKDRSEGPERPALVSMFVGNKQKCQVKVVKKNEGGGAHDTTLMQWL